jgi:hypothetical protein
MDTEPKADWEERDGHETNGKGKGQGDMHRRINSSNIKHSQSCSETTLTGESRFHICTYPHGV